MFELNGKYGSAKVFTDNADQESIAQVQLLLNQPFVEGSKIRLMPDIHAGAGCTIGTTMTITDKICPNLVGVDIGCGLIVAKVDAQDVDFDRLDSLIREKVPSGFSIHEKRREESYLVEDSIKSLRCAKHVNLDRALLSIGTLGGGNHFIELDKDSKGGYYLVIHSGSRHLGLEVANYYQRAGYERLNQSDDFSIQQLIFKMKSEGKHKQIEREVKKVRNTKTTNIPKDLAYVKGDLFEDYIHDMKIVQNFASMNRRAMSIAILVGMGWNVLDSFTTIHNYIDMDMRILRKGSVRSLSHEKFIIPINMRDGSLICLGKGNPDWNYSAPHGAGRLMSRAQAKRDLTVEAYAEQMNGIYTTCVGSSTLDESPMAYKSMDEILENIEPTAKVLDIIKPVYNFKAAD